MRTTDNPSSNVLCQTTPQTITTSERHRAPWQANVRLDKIYSHFEDDLHSQSLNWCENPAFSTKHLADIDETNKYWIGLCSVLHPHQQSIGYMGNGFYRSKDPTNSIKVLKEMLKKRKQTTKTTKYTHWQTICTQKGYTQNKHSKSPSLQ